MAANTAGLWSASARKWIELYALYPKAIKSKADKKTKPQARKELIELDDWFQNELPPLLQSRLKPYLTHEEIQKLMKWKLARGKFRPALPGLVAANKPDNVEKTTRSALQKLPNVEAAIRGLSALKGIGPATASAILAAAAPDLAPFMADECVIATPGITLIKYDLPCYLVYLESLRGVVKRLQKEEPDVDWTLHKAELTIWTHAILSSLAPELLPAKDTGKNKDTVDQDKPSASGDSRKRKPPTDRSTTESKRSKKRK